MLGLGGGLGGWSGDLDVAQVEDLELGEGRGLRGWVVICDLAQVGEDITLQEAALGSGGGDLGGVGDGDALLVQELGDGGVERVGGVLGLRGGGGLEAWWNG